MYFFSAKAFLILAIIIVKIVYLGFLASYTSRVALIIWISRVLSLLRLSIVSYMVSYLGLGLVLGTKCSKLFISFYNMETVKYIDNIRLCINTGIT